MPRPTQPSPRRTSHPVRLHAPGRHEGSATLETGGGSDLTITTADPLFRDIRPGRAVRVRLVDCWSEPLPVRDCVINAAAGTTMLTVGAPQSTSGRFVRRLATELLAAGASPTDLKSMRLPVPSLAHEVVVRRAQADELNKIILLRTLAYRHDGKYDSPDAFTDEFDEGATHLAAFFCGRAVAALRLMLPRDDEASEHQLYFQWPSDFPSPLEVADISRVCVHPDFRRCRILEALFQRAAAEVIRCGRRWLVGSAPEELLPMYERLGCVPTSIQWSDPEITGGISHTVFLCDVRSALLGMTKPLVWLFLWRKVARALLEDGVLQPQTLPERLRVRTMLGLGRVFDVVTE
jgi:hypothetical protein